ncbi:MAG: cytoplasmic protein [Ignavibacteriales bacterium]|nr:cytoplasmic protein [Ignavibacteriales bacterium]
MNRKKIAPSPALVVAGLLLLTMKLMAQDPVKLAPDKLNVILENDTVRVFEARLKPGEKLGMHSHPKSIAYFMSSFRLKSTFPDGRSVIIEKKPGDILWREPVRHSEENVGTTDLVVLVLEFKTFNPSEKK